MSGLVWEPLKQRAYMREAREIGKREQMDIVAIRLGFVAQAGFVKKDNGVTKGMYSLASALAGQIKLDAWIGAFKLPNGLYALVAVHNGLIVPDCDLIGERDQVLNRLKEMDSQTKVMEFAKAFHPEDFEYRGDPLDIEEVLRPEVLRKEYALKQLTFGLSRRELYQVGGGVAVALALIIGFTQWQAYQTREAQKIAQRLEAQRKKALEDLNARAGAEQTAQALQHPWADLPGVEDFLSGCQASIDALRLSIRGWPVQKAICTPETLEVVYGRVGKTTFNDLVAGAKGVFPSPPVLLEGGDTAGFGDVMSFGAGGDDQLLPFVDLQAEFTSYLQQLDLKAALQKVEIKLPPQPPLPGGEKPPPLPKPDWQQFSFELTSAYRPRDLFAGLHLKGLRVVEISVTRTGAETAWTVKGNLYAH